MRFSATILIPLLLLSRFTFGDENGVLFFEKHIRPALIEHCYDCHSHEAGKNKGGLYLDSKVGWETGGDIGPAIIPGDVENSLLLQVMRYEDPDLEMPPKKRLSAELVGKFEQWVAMGAPDPRLHRVPSVTVQGTEEDRTGYSLEEGREFWSFQPRSWEMPKAGKWAGTPIDRFIEAKLDEKGLKRPPLAPNEALLRRAKTDLTGLPLTVAEQEEFHADSSLKKWEEMIDRWLDDKAFGERWGRHWLDLARYADTSGGGRAMALHEAWKFRDFVIEAFNEDMPLDDLILSHIAGDLLPYQSDEERRKFLTSTGFLVLGPHNYENQNKALLDLEIADEQLDTVGRAFLGMTIGCARCHDHKFDPIPTEDYYSMAGIFLSSKSVTHSNVSKWHTEPVPGSLEVQAELAAHEAREKELQEAAIVAKLELEEAGGDSGKLDRVAKAEQLKGIVIDNSEADLIGKWVPSTHSPRYVNDGYVHDGHDKASRFAAIYSTVVAETGTYEIRMSYTASSNRSSRTPVTIAAGNHTEEVRVNQRKAPDFQSLFTRLGNFYVEKGELISVTIANDPGKLDGCVIADAIQILPYEPGNKSDNEIISLRKKYDETQKALTQHGKKKPKVPSVMAVSELSPDKIGDTRVRIRGDEDKHGDFAPRGFLQVASWGGQPVIPEERSGRLELAKWITDPQHPLTARVMANRVWLHLLGEGIVRTPDNLGTTGQLPSHPELLDYLAERLINSGWSIKALIKEVMLSEVYRFDSEIENTKAETIDPGNYYLWRANRRVLDVEVLRDTMLVAADTLDEAFGGPSLPKGFRSEFGYQFTTRKRSVYVPVFRNTNYEIFGLFDFANPNFAVGKRSQSAVPTQALYLLNSPEVHRYSSEAASYLLQEQDENYNQRLDRVFQTTLGRKPGEREAQWAARLFPTEESRMDADRWATLYRMIFASLDFRFLR